MNVENNDKKSLLWPIVIRLLDHALCRPSIYVPSFASNEMPHNSSKFLEDSSFGSYFNDLQKLV